jgi:Ni,Fe-hydrogenase I large subunit
VKRKTIDTSVGFDDAELKSYKKEDASFVVEILAWNESQITLVFDDVIRVLDNDANAVSAFFAVVENTEFLELALTRLYEAEVPSNHPYKHYQLLDNDDNAALEVVSGSMEIKYS